MDPEVKKLLQKLRAIFITMPEGEDKKAMRKAIEDLVRGDLDASRIKDRLGPIYKNIVIGLIKNDSLEEAKCVISLMRD